MKIQVGILDVDGEASTTQRTNQPEIALAFLRDHDHKGSSIRLTVITECAEEVYKILEALK